MTIVFQELLLITGFVAHWIAETTVGIVVELCVCVDSPLGRVRQRGTAGSLLGFRRVLSLHEVVHENYTTNLFPGVTGYLASQEILHPRSIYIS